MAPATNERGQAALEHHGFAVLGDLAARRRCGIVGSSTFSLLTVPKEFLTNSFLEPGAETDGQGKSPLVGS